MKKCLSLLLAGVTLVSLCACNTTPDTSEGRVDTTATTTTTQPVKMDLPDHFLAVMRSEQTFVMDKTYFNGEAITLSHLLGKYDIDSINRYTLVDMDADDVPELVIAFNSQDDKLVIKKDGNNYYGHLYGMRGMYQLNQDGTYHWNSNAGKIHGCSRVRFNGTQRVETELWREELKEDDTFDFFVDGKAVTEDAYLATTANIAPEVTWVDWDESSIITTFKTDGTAMTDAELFAVQINGGILPRAITASVDFSDVEE